MANLLFQPRFNGFHGAFQKHELLVLQDLIHTELIRSHTGAKSCISASPQKIAEIKDALAEEGGRRAVQTLKAAGYSKAEAIAMIERYWDAEDRRESEK